MTEQVQPSPQQPSSEWFWRIFAALMVVMLGWTGWVAYHLNPAMVATPQAYQALARVRAQQHVQEGLIRPASMALEPALQPVSQVVAPAVPRKALVDIEKLRLAESIETPIVTKAR